jgi:hypothetical protein
MNQIFQISTVVLSGLIFSGQTSGSDKALKRKIVLEDCGTPVDDPTGQTRAKHWAEIQAMASNGREALVQIAQLPKSRLRASEVGGDPRPCALGYLARLKDPRAASIARKTVANSQEDSSFRYQAVEILGDIGDKESVRLLISLLKSGDRELARLVAEALGKIDDDRARSALREVLVDDSVRQKSSSDLLHPYALYLSTVISSIGHQHDSQAFEELEKLAKTESADEVRGSLSYALAKIGIWNGNLDPALGLISASPNLEQKRQILHAVIGGLWEDYWGSDPRFSKSWHVEQAIRKFEALY